MNGIVIALHRTAAALTALLVLGAPMPGRAQDAGVTALLEATKAITVFDYVTAETRDGVVTLAGKVTSAVKRDQIQSEIATVPGVKRVVNHISVLPASGTDDALRRRVARAIYGHPLFRTYAAQSQPPIRVVVEHGHVTLAGTAQNGVEREMARALADAEAPHRVTVDLAVGR